MFSLLHLSKQIKGALRPTPPAVIQVQSSENVCHASQLAEDDAKVKKKEKRKTPFLDFILFVLESERHFILKYYWILFKSLRPGTKQPTDWDRSGDQGLGTAAVWDDVVSEKAFYINFIF